MAVYCMENPIPYDLSCPICFEEYDILSVQRAPKLLLCLHTFCYGCTQQLWKADGTLECSLCRTVHYEVTLSDLFDNPVILQHLRKKNEEEDLEFARTLDRELRNREQSSDIIDLTNTNVRKTEDKEDNNRNTTQPAVDPRLDGITTQQQQQQEQALDQQQQQQLEPPPPQQPQVQPPPQQQQYVMITTQPLQPTTTQEQQDQTPQPQIQPDDDGDDDWNRELDQDDVDEWVDLQFPGCITLDEDRAGTDEDGDSTNDPDGSVGDADETLDNVDDSVQIINDSEGDNERGGVCSPLLFDIDDRELDEDDEDDDEDEVFHSARGGYVSPSCVDESSTDDVDDRGEPEFYNYEDYSDGFCNDDDDYDDDDAGYAWNWL